MARESDREWNQIFVVFLVHLIMARKSDGSFRRRLERQPTAMKRMLSSKLYLAAAIIAANGVSWIGITAYTRHRRINDAVIKLI